MGALLVIVLVVPTMPSKVHGGRQSLKKMGWPMV
jgi:hypothetical protein